MKICQNRPNSGQFSAADVTVMAGKGFGFKGGGGLVLLMSLSWVEVVECGGYGGTEYREGEGSKERKELRGRGGRVLRRFRGLRWMDVVVMEGGSVGRRRRRKRAEGRRKERK
ncbi:unnamed protein product [Prunus armeniaca]